MKQRKYNCFFYLLILKFIKKKQKHYFPRLTSNPIIDCKNSVIYLRALLSNKDGQEEEIKRRIYMSKTAIAKLVKIWKDHDIKKGMKLYFMKIMIFLIMTYGY